MTTATRASSRSLIVFAPFLTIALILACTSAPSVKSSSQFRVEPAYRKSIGPTRNLTAGETITLKVTNVGEHLRVRLHVCTAKPCTRARMVKMWSKSDFASTDTTSLPVPENGEYYLWVQDVSEDPEGVSVEAVRWHDDGRYLVVEYKSGLKVAATLGPA